MTYIQSDLTTTSYELPGISWPLTGELEAKFRQYNAFSRLVITDGELTDIVFDAEKKAAFDQSKNEEAELSEGEILAWTLRTVRQERAYLFKAFDIYKANVEYGILTETEETHNENLVWYQTLLDLPATVAASGELIWPEIPVGIRAYLPDGYIPAAAMDEYMLSRLAP